VPVKIIVVQAVLIVLVIGWYKVCLPRFERAHAAALAADRERRIEDYEQEMIVEDTRREVTSPSGASVHPQQLKSTPDVDEVEHDLGVPQTSMTDFSGGYHLTWIGTAHKLQASFNKGQLYSISIEDLATGHGAEVFESSDEWRPF
jgi:hypothetical protein